MRTSPRPVNATETRSPTCSSVVTAIAPVITRLPTGGKLYSVRDWQDESLTAPIENPNQRIDSLGMAVRYVPNLDGYGEAYDSFDFVMRLEGLDDDDTTIQSPAVTYTIDVS